MHAGRLASILADMLEDKSGGRRRSLAQRPLLGRIRSVSAKLSSLGAFGAALPLAMVGGLTVTVARYSFEKTAILQIGDTLEGAHSILDEYHSLVSLGRMSEQRAFAMVRRLFLGDLTELSIETVDASEAERFFAELMRHQSEEGREVYGLPETIPLELREGRAYLRDPFPLSRAQEAFDSMSLEAQFGLVNGPFALRLRYDIQKAGVRLRDSGYVFSLSATVNAMEGPAYELFHPTLTMVNVNDVRNSRGEQVGRRISMLFGKPERILPAGYYRYESLWKNPGEDR